MTEINNIESEQESTALNLVGGRLRMERESQGLSCEEMAIQMHLSVQLIKALEAGDEEHLPPMNYIIGYLRTYARLLNIHADELLSELPQDEEKFSQLVSTTSSGTQVSSRDLPVRLVSYLIILGLIALVVVWWFNRHKEQPTQPETVIESIEPGQSGELALPPVQLEADEGESEKPVVAPVEEAVEESATTDEPEQSIDTHVSEVTPVSEPVTTESVKAEVDQETTDSDEAVLQNLRLVLNQDSWVEIKDTLGRQVVYGLIEEGKTIDVEGVAPFAVLLGYAPGVDFYYNGELFDHSRYHRQDVARFTLGLPDQERP